MRYNATLLVLGIIVVGLKGACCVEYATAFRTARDVFTVPSVAAFDRTSYSRSALTHANRRNSKEGADSRKVYQSLPLLTVEEEIALGRYSAMGRLVMSALGRVQTAQCDTSTGQEAPLARQYDLESLLKFYAVASNARRRLVARNIRIVAKWAREVMLQCREGAHVSYYELQVLGILGLAKAAVRYDSGRGCRFLTYARPYVMRELLHGLTTLRTGCWLSPHCADICFRAYKARGRLTLQLHRPPTDDELAEELGISATRLRSVLFDAKTKHVAISASASPGSPNSRTVGGHGDDDGNLTYLRVLRSPLATEEALTESHAAQYSALSEALARTLTATELRTLSIRFGLLGWTGRPQSVEATAALMCVSTEGVRRILLRAYDKLRCEAPADCDTSSQDSLDHSPSSSAAREESVAAQLADHLALRSAASAPTPQVRWVY